MNVDITRTATHRNSVCGQQLQHIPKEIKFKIDRVKNWPRIIAAFPTENRPGFSKGKAERANVFMACFPLQQIAVKAKLFFCFFLIEEKPQHQNCEQMDWNRLSKMARLPGQSPGRTAMLWLFPSTKQEGLPYIINFV